MFVILLAVALAATPVGAVGRFCRTKTTTVLSCGDACVCPQAKKPVHVVKKKIVKTQVEVKRCCGTTQSQTQSQQVIIQIQGGEPRVVNVRSSEQAYVGPSVGIGVRGAVGLWSCSPHVFGLVGLRMRFFPAHLGLEANTQFYWGHSLQAMVYPVQGPLAWHLDVGGLWFNHYGFSAQDVPRSWDLLFGTGLEFKVLPHLSLTADYRLTFPNPGAMGNAPDDHGKYLNTGNVVGNSFMRSQLMLGLMLHTW